MCDPAKQAKSDSDMSANHKKSANFQSHTQSSNYTAALNQDE